MSVTFKKESSRNIMFFIEKIDKFLSWSIFYSIFIVNNNKIGIQSSVVVTQKQDSDNSCEAKDQQFGQQNKPLMKYFFIFDHFHHIILVFNPLCFDLIEICWVQPAKSKWIHFELSSFSNKTCALWISFFNEHWMLDYCFQTQQPVLKIFVSTQLQKQKGTYISLLKMLKSTLIALLINEFI